MVEIKEGYVYITSGDVVGNTITGGITVKIRVSGSIENNIDKELKLIKPGEGTSLMVDLNRPEETYTINGELTYDSPTDTALTKRDNLKTLATLTQTGSIMGQPVTLVYNNNSVQVIHTDCYFKKLMIRETPDVAQQIENLRLKVVIMLMRGQSIT